MLLSIIFLQNSFSQQTEKFPSKQITVIVGFAPGGGGDISSRWIADYLRERWKVPVVIENRPGAGATIAAGLLSKAKPDGYTVALATTSPFTVAPYFQSVSYDPSKDFTFLFQTLVSAQPLFVKSDSPFKSIQEMMAWAKANPNKLFGQRPRRMGELISQHKQHFERLQYRLHMYHIKVEQKL